MRSPRRSTLLLAAALVLGVPSLGHPTDTPQELVALGARAIAAGEYFAAVEEFQSALARNPNFTDALAGLAEAYYWLFEYDQAAFYARDALRVGGESPRLLTLAGRIAIGGGDLDAASALFARAVAVEPNNVDARMGQAELAIAQGQSGEAIASLERSLQINPEHRKTLLSLALVYEQLGEQEIARTYLELALRFHRDSSEVHTVAAEFLSRRGNYLAARDAARTALTITPGSPSALRMIAEASILVGEYDEALAVAERLIGVDRADVRAWYMRSVSQYRLGDVPGALTSIRTALAIDDGAEIARLWAEWIALRELGLEDPVRQELAAARAATARRMEGQFRFDQALRTFRRALQLAPLDLSLRLEFAEVNRRAGYDATYLRELEVLVENGEERQSVLRAIEVFTNALRSSVASDWQIDQFTIERSRTPIGIYASEQAISGYPEALESLIGFVVRAVSSEADVQVVDSGIVEGFRGAYERARGSSVHYFIQLDIESSDRLFGISGTLFVGRTGAPVARAQSLRSGSGMVANAIDAFVSRTVTPLPLGARVLERAGTAALIDRGERDGLAVGQELRLLDPSGVTLAPSELGFSYSSAAELGTLTVLAVDEFVAEGSIAFIGPTDLVAVGDMAITTEEINTEAVGSPLFPVLYERIRRLR